jgi:hypothetical protein
MKNSDFKYRKKNSISLNMNLRERWLELGQGHVNWRTVVLLILKFLVLSLLKLVVAQA